MFGALKPEYGRFFPVCDGAEQAAGVLRCFFSVRPHLLGAFIVRKGGEGQRGGGDGEGGEGRGVVEGGGRGEGARDWSC